jgi:hypothetical protein
MLPSAQARALPGGKEDGRARGKTVSTRPRAGGSWAGEASSQGWRGR